MHPIILGWLDYLIFTVTLGFSVAIGIYFACFKKKQNSAKQYLYGNGQMKTLPIGMSLFSSTVTAVVILGVPSEMYVFGSQYMMMPIGAITAMFITWYLILPVFCGNLKITSPYEYIELRFSYTVRLISCIIYFMHTLLYMPVVLYACTIAVSEATGVSLEVCVAVIGGICVFYTTVGGFISVIWTDTLQAALIMGSCIFVLSKGATQVGGMAEVWRRAELGNRIILFNMDPSPFERMTFWSTSLGMTVFYVSHTGCTAGALQRYMALPSEKHARIGCFINLIASVGTVVLTCLIGLSMYALFYDCDPVATKKLNSYNQMVPYFVSQIVENIPGFYGFFIAGLLSCGLSTLSAEMNTVGGFLYFDIIQKILKKPLEPAREALVIKMLVFINGVYYLIAAPQFQKTNYIFQVASIISGITYGVKVAVMILGTTFPKCNSKGVICGMISAIAVITWISIGSLYYDVAAPYMLPMSTNCSSLPNATFTNNMIIRNISNTSPVGLTTHVGEPLLIYKLSVKYYPVLGLTITMFISLVISYLTTPNDVNKMDPNLIIPCRRPRRTSISLPVY